MGQYRTRTATILGVRAVPVDVEVDVGAGLPSFSIVGLPDAAVVEARERVRAAIRASGFELAPARVVVNLAPGPLRKHGTGFDLPIALGLLVATGQIPRQVLDGVSAVGELSLDGCVRGVSGLIAHALTAREAGRPLLGPAGYASSCAVDGGVYLPLARLADIRQGLPSSAPVADGIEPVGESADFSEVVGQELAVRALVVAAAGGHNLLMIGPPGSGKTMLARRLPTILPPLNGSERLESALVHSVAGLDSAPLLAGQRPFRAPHHSASIAGLVGGGTPPRPGEASLAHNGVLFLDEMSEFGPAALQCLRQPLEDGTIAIVRADGRVSLPARFALVGAANPCPCGFLGDPARSCRCQPQVIDRYRARIGGPLMDRIDIVLHVDRPAPERLLEQPASRSSAGLRAEVLAARARAVARDGVPTAQLSGTQLLAACGMSAETKTSLESAARRHHLSGRGVTRLLRVARTIADLEAADRVRMGHLAEALGYRAGDEA